MLVKSSIWKHSKERWNKTQRTVDWSALIWINQFCCVVETTSIRMMCVPYHHTHATLSITRTGHVFVRTYIHENLHNTPVVDVVKFTHHTNRAVHKKGVHLRRRHQSLICYARCTQHNHNNNRASAKSEMCAVRSCSFTGDCSYLI